MAYSIRTFPGPGKFCQQLRLEALASVPRSLVQVFFSEAYALRPTCYAFSSSPGDMKRSTQRNPSSTISASTVPTTASP